MRQANDKVYHPENFAPSLTEALKNAPLDLKKMICADVPVERQDIRPGLLPPSFDRTLVLLSDGHAKCRWNPGLLQGLFRGDKPAPVLGDHPEGYDDCFATLESHAVEVSNVLGDRRDEEMLEIYSYLRRRPDGKSQGFVHDYMWQAAAFLLAIRPLSQAEYEAILSRLERSCRTFRMGPSSRNYIPAIRRLF